MQNKFSTYLTEAGFYFANINNPKRTLWGQVKVKSNGEEDVEASTEREEEDDRIKKFALYQQTVTAAE